MAQKHLASPWHWTSEWPSCGTVMSISSMKWNLYLDESFVLNGHKFTNQAARQAPRNVL